MRELLCIIATAAMLTGCQSIVYSGDPTRLATIHIEQFSPTDNCTGKGISQLSIRPFPGGEYRQIDKSEVLLRPGRYSFCYLAKYETGLAAHCAVWIETSTGSCGRTLPVDVVAGTTYSLVVKENQSAELRAL